MSNQLSEIMFVVEEADDGSYRASAVGESIYTEADNLENLHSEIRDAVQCHFEDGKTPALIRLHHVWQELLAL
ncbi:2-oxoisovalerate dehydrogenase [Synechococcus sp. UW140]|uniref:2-oxoisovalerate dehydrogenase n=1 Tax=Synechococcus sp. UW140 TaxID=368503 RepID=UPI0025ED73F5|nr:2-oxoisovalerate dehydrogenase [Synechococcus sp. UW140]